MTKAIEVITSVERRRRWSRAEKERIVAAALEPGAVASEVARAAGIHTSQLFWWRQELCRSAQGGAESAPTFSAVTIAPALPEPAAIPTPAVPAPPVEQRGGDRVCERGADADRGRSRSVDGVGNDRGADDDEAKAAVARLQTSGLNQVKDLHRPRWLSDNIPSGRTGAPVRRCCSS